jgi:hypothetical protein
MRVFSSEQCDYSEAAVSAFFALRGFFGFFLCSLMGGEYDDAVLELAPVPGLALWANAAGLPDANSTAAATTRTGVSFFMFEFSVTDQRLGRGASVV